MKVNWSPRLETLADGLLEQWAELSRREASPFGKICIVVNDKASENWLKQYALLVKKMPQVMMNVDFVMLSEFINDWLEAQVHGVAPRERKASMHPYSQEVLTWRIYRILSNAKEGSELDTLLAYLKKDEKNIAKRRYALSARLARLYDDYLNSRFQMLNNWEQQIVDGDVPAWQPVLYRMLVQEGFGSTYAQDYAKAFQPGADAHKALDCGFPKYMAIHVFDTPFMSEPTLRILEKMAEAFPMTFWLFNPQGDWLADTPAEKEVKRTIRRLLQEGKIPAELAVDLKDRYYDSPEERLLGAMASGARAVLGTLFDDVEGDVKITGDASGSPFADLDIAVHRCYSPRRELEAIRDGLHDFFTTHKDAKPHDAIVLCGDWETYAPIIETVFNPDAAKEGYIPCTVDKGTSGETPLTQSFRDLLAFGENRFEASAVFNLLSVPAIREKLGLDDKAVDELKNMVANANIHWGADDDDVAKALQMDTTRENTFTWQRGLDRLVAEMLYGFPEDNDTLINVAGKQVHPVGHVEADRATAVSALWHFVQELKALKAELSGERKLEQLRELLNGVIDKFYSDEQEYLYDLAIIRNAINKAASSIEAAGMKDELIDAKVFISAVQGIISSNAPGMRTPADAVLIAPLKNSYATPHKYVWICGMSEGTFPHNEHRISFDLIGRHPSHFDASSKERDAFAMLKAALGAREQLRLSFVGTDVHSNEKQPSSVLLNDMLDYFKAKGIAFREYSHPLHTFSRAYFRQGNELPDTYDRESQEIAALLQIEDKPREFSQIAAFKLNEKGPTEMPLSELEEYYNDPRRFVFVHRLKIKPHYSFDLNDDEQFGAALSWGHIEYLSLKETSDEQHRHLAELAVETGEAATVQDAGSAIADALNNHSRRLKYGNNDARNCIWGDDIMTFAKAYELYENEKATACSLELELSTGEKVFIPMLFKTISLMTLGGPEKHSVIFDPYGNLNGAYVRHLAYNALGGGDIATVVFRASDAATRFDPVEAEDAKLKLTQLVELAMAKVPEDVLSYGDFASNGELQLDEVEKALSDMVNLTRKTTQK
ncbi:MAG: exodeoxyribonuclease V subunit gamma [Victivallales bacterium]|nr:exodeoxyribonuclease V subunit gamma [Victivallales bacterium]